jgi:hypothetical protein
MVHHAVAGGVEGVSDLAGNSVPEFIRNSIMYGVHRAPTRGMIAHFFIFQLGKVANFIRK